MSENVKVYIVDDDEGMRSSMSFVLKKAGIDCQAYASGTVFLEEWDGANPGCLVVDFQMPDMSGLKLIQEIRVRFGLIPFVLVTGYGTVEMAVEAMKLGAITVIEKPFHHEVFIDAVKTAVSVDVQRRDTEQQHAELANRMKLLTAREREIADLVVQGSLTKQIAKSLGISTKTVEVHRSHITKKLGVESVAQLVKMVLHAPSNSR